MSDLTEKSLVKKAISLIESGHSVKTIAQIQGPFTAVVGCAFKDVLEYGATDYEAIENELVKFAKSKRAHEMTSLLKRAMKLPAL